METHPYGVLEEAKREGREEICYRRKADRDYASGRLQHLRMFEQGRIDELAILFEARQRGLCGEQLWQKCPAIGKGGHHPSRRLAGRCYGWLVPIRHKNGCGRWQNRRHDRCPLRVPLTDGRAGRAPSRARTPERSTPEAWLDAALAVRLCTTDSDRAIPAYFPRVCA